MLCSVTEPRQALQYFNKQGFWDHRYSKCMYLQVRPASGPLSCAAEHFTWPKIIAPSLQGLTECSEKSKGGYCLAAVVG